MKEVVLIIRKCLARIEQIVIVGFVKQITMILGRKNR